MRYSCAIVDTSCLIGLSHLHLLSLPLAFYEAVLIPPSVQAEFGELEAGYCIQSPANRDLVVSLCLTLGRGEAEVIALGLEKRQEGIGCELVLDDRRARQIAHEFGLRVVGTVGLLVRAKRQGHVGSVRELLERLQAGGFRLSTDLLKQALVLAGEPEEEASDSG
ncbi:MAG: DUF3368 domain-containing protein [Fimbriimonadales bacterium]